LKRLSLMRHANAQWKDPQLADFDRPLNRRGNAEAEAIARRLLELRLVPTAVLASSARRAQQTAERALVVWGLSSRSVRREESLYLAPAEEILRIVHGTGPRIPHLLIVGHNPGIAEAARLLGPTGSVPDLTTGAVCSLTFDVDSWAEVGPGNVCDVLNEVPPPRPFALWA
jgi:phosphohistidine phosphatase